MPVPSAFCGVTRVTCLHGLSSKTGTLGTGAFAEGLVPSLGLLTSVRSRRLDFLARMDTCVEAALFSQKAIPAPAACSAAACDLCRRPHAAANSSLKGASNRTRPPLRPRSI